MSPARRPASAPSLIVALYGAFIRDLGGWIAVSDLLDLLDQLGIDSQTGRTAVTRLKRSGLLVAEAIDARPGYRAGTELLEVLADGDARLFATDRGADLADGWLIITFTIPEAKRDRRHVMRSRLAALGCGALAPGVFIAPRRAEADVTRMLHEHRLDRYVSMFVGAYHGPADVHHLAKEVWGTAKDLSAQYRAFLVAHRATPPRSAAAAFGRYVAALEDWRALVYADPGLPDVLSHVAEARTAAAARFASLRAVLAAPALDHVRATVGDRPRLLRPRSTPR